MVSSGASNVGVFLYLAKSTAAVDVIRAILHPQTFEDSLCIYVVAVFLGGWIILLTFVFSYWLYFRAPIPNYTYELVTVSNVQSAGRDTISTSECQDQAAGGSARGSTSDGRSLKSKEPSELARTSKELSQKYHTPELFAYGEAPTQQVSVMEDKVVAQEG
ncbi:unnamed protein product [Cylicocyclus nassatus]|uniref:Uncharacterized protein n=1 Tax=Cylicocyclus nassatus TaxID=53992 RepID=A0AA36M2P2_CYLNA|nr:unnamed protein product [Cylicocyclus nassatus]